MTSYHNPLASVCIITYNHEKYISQAIESVLMQKTNFAWEIVIGEDCSQDFTAQILSKYKDKFPNQITLILQEKNVGAIRNAYEFSIPACRGKYIAFLEGDDYWTDEFKLQKQVDFLESNPDYGLVHGDVNHYYQESNSMIMAYNRTNSIKIPQGSIFEDLLIPSHLIKTMTVCFRKELVEKYFNYGIAIERKWLLSDLPLWLDISYHSKIHYFDAVFATYRLADESASRSKSVEKKYQYFLSVLDIFKVYTQKCACSNATMRHINDYKIKKLIRFSLLFGNSVCLYGNLNVENIFDFSCKFRYKVVYILFRIKPFFFIAKKTINFLYNENK